MLDGIELGQRLRLEGAAQRAVEVIAPAMEGAGHNQRAMAALFGQHARSAVAAKVVEGAHLAVLAAHHDGALANDVEGHVIAGLGNVVDMADQLLPS